MTARGSTLNSAALNVVGRYLIFATALAAWSAVRGKGGLVAVAGYAVLIAAIEFAVRSDRKASHVLHDWLPLLALPVLYAAIPRTAIGIGPFDGMMQQWDRFIFRADVARSFADAAPWRPLGELLHAAYLSYYAIIYVPPLLMYLRGDTEAFARTVYAFAVAMVICFVVFCVFPVDGPRYAWPAPAGVPDGMFRRIVVAILERGSTRWTALPSSHMAIALTMSLSSLSWDRRLGLPVLLLSILLGLGAVYGGFHYGVDVLLGAIVGFAAWFWAGGHSRSPKPL
jgi:membrane-associated phospholipid phosphatase